MLGGKREDKGMASFERHADRGEADGIHAYLIKRAQDDYQPNFMDLVKRQ